MKTMNGFLSMHKRCVLVMMLIGVLFQTASAQKVYTKQFDDKNLVKTAKSWMKKGEWRNGFNSAKPDKSVNAADFYTQYQKNKEQWDAAFRWLATHDLTGISKGRHPIEGTSLTASVEDSENYDLSRQQSESHYHHIDLQYCVSGVEGFGIIEHNGSKPNCEYRPDVIHYDYVAKDAKFYNSRPDRFFLFFPNDWHIAKVKTKKATDKIRVIVIKLDYIE